MWLAEVVPPAGPLWIPALAALFTLAALFFAIGIVKLVDKVSRAFFGTVGGAVGWIPFAGKIVKHSLHKIEQKISHILGSAERTLDGYVAVTWHHMAKLVTQMGKEIEGAAVSAWHLAQQARAFVRGREMNQSIRSATKPLRATDAQLKSDQLTREAQIRALNKSVALGVYPRLGALEHGYTDVLHPGLESARDQAKAAERAAANAWRWFRTHPHTIVTGAFLGAIAFALGKLGGGWIRCSNWRKLGKHGCGSLGSLLVEFIEIGVTALLLRDLCALVGAIEKEAIRAEPTITRLVLEVEGFICGGQAALPSAIVASDRARVSARASAL